MFRTSVQQSFCAVAMALVGLPTGAAKAQEIPLGGFIPLVGVTLTDEFKDAGLDLTGTFFISDPEFSLVGSQLSGGVSPYYDIALLDTGAATHIFTSPTAGPGGFDINGNGFDGENFQQIGGAAGVIDLAINDPLAVYAAGLGDRSSAGASLTMDAGAFRGQSSFATLSAPPSWQLPNIIGLPMAAHHAIQIRNDQPQIFQHQGRTVRTPQIDFIDLGTGGEQGIQRRTNLRIRPGASYVVGPIYVQGFDLFNFEFHENPTSPSVIENGAFFLEADLAHGDARFEDMEMLFDTGANITAVSELFAKRLGFDVVLDEPDFVIQVEGSAGIVGDVPGFYLDELNIDTVGGSFTAHNVPIAVLDLVNPNDPGNIANGVLGTQLFNDRNLVIDANPAIGQGGVGPSLYISDPVTEVHAWATASTSADWATADAWLAPGEPSSLWKTRLNNVTGTPQTAVVSDDSTVFEVHVAGEPTATMTLDVQSGATLYVYGETRIDSGGEVRLSGGMLDTQTVLLQGGVLSGDGEIFAGAGPITGVVQNIAGRIAPGEAGNPTGNLTIGDDLSNEVGATMAFDLGGASPSQYDRVDVDRLAFLRGILEVSLADLGGGLFQPTAGNSFTLLTAGESVIGEFDQLLLPAGFQWDVDYLANSVVLQVLGTIEILDGDFNSDGVVDGGDRATWETGFGTTYHGGDLLTWQRNYGAGASVLIGVPEPSTVALAALVALTALSGRLSVFRTFGAQRAGRDDRPIRRESGRDPTVLFQRDFDPHSHPLDVGRDHVRRHGDAPAPGADDAENAVGLGNRFVGGGAWNHRMTRRLVGRIVGRMPDYVESAKFERRDHEQKKDRRRDGELNRSRPAPIPAT